MKPEVLAEGTRCACSHCPECVDKPEPTFGHSMMAECTREAVHMVTVREPLFAIHDDDLSDVLVGYKAKTTRERPMCEPCARWHEQKAGAR